MLNKIKKIIDSCRDRHRWFNRYELEYRILMLIAVVYLLLSHHNVC